MKRKRRIASKLNVESILAAVGFYGLTEEDLTDRAKLDEAFIRYQADLALTKLKKRLRVPPVSRREELQLF